MAESAVMTPLDTRHWLKDMNPEAKAACTLYESIIYRFGLMKIAIMLWLMHLEATRGN